VADRVFLRLRIKSALRIPSRCARMCLFNSKMSAHWQQPMCAGDQGWGRRGCAENCGADLTGPPALHVRRRRGPPCRCAAGPSRAGRRRTAASETAETFAGSPVERRRNHRGPCPRRVRGRGSGRTDSPSSAPPPGRFYAPVHVMPRPRPRLQEWLRWLGPRGRVSIMVHASTVAPKAMFYRWKGRHHSDCVGNVAERAHGGHKVVPMEKIRRNEFPVI
jgi:hypothetical protein